MDRAGGRLDPGNLEVFPAKLNLILGPQALHNLQGLPHALDPVASLRPKGNIFLVAVAEANAEDEPASAYGVHSRYAFRQLHRIVQR